MEKIDVICPIYHIDWNFFSSNVESWFREVNVNRLLISYNNPDQKLFDTLNTYLHKKYPEETIHILDHRGYKTLGKCLAVLMNYVDTDWFVYVHADAELTGRVMNIMDTYMGKKTGIIESDRLHYDGKVYTYEPYYFAERSYSGFQLIRREAIIDVVNSIDDDYVYRNEDLIWQNACINNNYFYIKTLAMHIHQITTTKNWTFSRENVYDMQWRGLVKYTTPTDITVQACMDALRTCINEFEFDVNEILKNMNPRWQNAIIKKVFK